jgi:H+/gluconate symporter-like permease
VNGTVFLAAASSLGPALFALRADPPDANNSCEAAAVAAASACAPLPPPPAAFEVAGNLTLDAAGNASAFPLGAVWPALQGVTATATSEWARVDAVASDESRTRATLALVLGAASYDALSRMAARLRAATSVAGLAVVSLSMQLPPPPPPVDPLPPDSRPRITVALPIGMGVLIALAGGLLAARWLREQRRLAREEAAEGFMLHRRQDEADL